MSSAFPPPPSPLPPPPLPSPSGRAVSAGSDWPRCPAEEIGEWDHPGSDFPGWVVGVRKVEPASRAALHVSRGQRAATVYCAQRDRSPSAGPGSATAAGAVPAAPAEPGTQVKKKKKKKIQELGRSLRKLSPHPANCIERRRRCHPRAHGYPVASGFGCLPRLESVPRAATARSAPPSRKSDCLWENTRRAAFCLE